MTEQAGAAVSMAAVFPTGSMGDAVGFVSAVLGIEPTFVDGDRWAQFDLDGARLALGARTETSGAPRVMVKVAGLEAVAARLAAAGYEVTGPVTGPHERRVSVTGPDGWDAVLYEPLGK